ncbi:MAG: succinyl-diaminopimelate desuccinylase [Legionellaceae bacterium]|nr:succinyl-diaminopimelate desuccinylase [Legionellaceae bacterium]
MQNKLKKILADLVAFESVTPNDCDCQSYMLDILEKLNFRIQILNKDPVANFYAEYGDSGPLLVFAGHTDVVPTGDLTKWDSPPFELFEKDGMVYGRGVADMKGSLASMLVAAERFVSSHPKPTGRLGLLITSGEEGDHYMQGTPHVMDKLEEQGIKPDYCIVGEPSSTENVGDVMKIGRRGSLSGRAFIPGIQGHVAYPHLAKNPIHMLAPVLNELTSVTWDEGGEYFPPTSLQVTHIKSGGEASNVIPGEIILHFNIRYSTEQTAKKLQKSILDCFSKFGIDPSIEWDLSGEPFLTTKGRLLDCCVQAIKEITNREPLLSTSGGTSDGRFIAPRGVELVELGPVNKTIHQINESVSLDDLDILANLYYSICEKLL